MIKRSLLLLGLACASVVGAGCVVEDSQEGEDDELALEEEEAVGTDQEELNWHPQPFDVTFTNCEDTAGITPISRAAAQTKVPAGFTLAGSGDTAPFVVRIAHCQGISVDGQWAQKGTVVQVGVTIVAPDGNTANLNNYTGWYYTDHLGLAIRLAIAGMDVQWSPLLKYKYAKNAAQTGGTLELKVPGFPSFRVDGTVVEPTVPPVFYEANWWQEGHFGLVQLDTVLPAISFGQAPVLSITTPPNSDIADLIGGPFANFTSFHSFSRSTPELMHVSVE
jgi:hypothetical protein